MFGHNQADCVGATSSCSGSRYSAREPISKFSMFLF